MSCYFTFFLFDIFSLFLYIWHFWKKILISTLQTLYFITTFLFSIRQFMAVTIMFKVPGLNIIYLIISSINFLFPKNIPRLILCFIFFIKACHPHSILFTWHFWFGCLLSARWFWEAPKLHEVDIILLGILLCNGLDFKSHNTLISKLALSLWY